MYGRLGVQIGEVQLVLDRTAADAALAGDVGRMIVLSRILMALVIGLGFAALLNRSVLTPLNELREAIHSLRAGAAHTRLGGAGATSSASCRATSTRWPRSCRSRTRGSSRSR